MTASDGYLVTTPCPTPCDPGCELGAAGCHERHLVPWKRSHDPGGCERERAALDEHSRLSAELEAGDRAALIGRIMDEELPRFAGVIERLKDS